MVEENKEVFLVKVLEIIFELSSCNDFNQEVYAKIITKMIDDYKIENVVLTYLNSVLEKYSTYEYVDPEKNYDLFCDLNKKNEERRFMNMFLEHLYQQNVISYSLMLEQLKTVFNLFEENVKTEGNYYICETQTEIIKVLTIAIWKKQVKCAEFDNIQSVIDIYSNKMPRSMPSYSNKCLFNIMDISDFIENFDE